MDFNFNQQTACLKFFYKKTNQTAVSCVQPQPRGAMVRGQKCLKVSIYASRPFSLVTFRCPLKIAQISVDFFEFVGSVIAHSLLQHFHRTAKHTILRRYLGTNRSTLISFAFVSRLRRGKGANESGSKLTF